MKKTIKQKILYFTEKCEIKPTEKFSVLHYEKGYIVLKDENLMLRYIINNECYKEKIRVYPIFNLQEIKEALTTPKRKEVLNGNSTNTQNQNATEINQSDAKNNQ